MNSIIRKKILPVSFITADWCDIVNLLGWSKYKIHNITTYQICKFLVCSHSVTWNHHCSLGVQCSWISWVTLTNVKQNNDLPCIETKLVTQILIIHEHCPPPLPPPDKNDSTVKSKFTIRIRFKILNSNSTCYFCNIHWTTGIPALRPPLS